MVWTVFSDAYMMPATAREAVLRNETLDRRISTVYSLLSLHQLNVHLVVVFDVLFFTLTFSP